MEIHEDRDGQGLLAELLHDVVDAVGVKAERVHRFAVVGLEELEAFASKVERARSLGIVLSEADSAWRGR